MFYSNFIFVRKGKLSACWLAAHFQRKLTRTHVTDTDIGISVKDIKDPTQPLVRSRNSSLCVLTPEFVQFLLCLW
jgi:cohesin complex subunit SCC1